MRIIDERGRLFRKINIVDFLVILLLLCLAPIFFFGYKILTKKSIMIMPEKEFIETEIDTLFIKVKPELLKHITVGDKELDENREVIGEIVSLGQSEPYRYEFDIGENQKIIEEDPVLRQIEARLKLKPEVKEEKPYYKDKEIKIGLPIEFKTSNYIIIAIPSEEEEEEEKEKWMSLRAKFSRVVPEIAKIVQEGDIEKDAFMRTIARIRSIISNKPSLVTSIYEGAFITLNHPFDRDIEVSLEVLCVEKEGAYYFKNDLTKMGNNIKFIADLYSVSGLIIGIRVK